jgi:hypothetical protein
MHHQLLLSTREKGKVAGAIFALSVRGGQYLDRSEDRFELAGRTRDHL